MRWVHSARYSVDIGAHTFPTRKFQRVAELLLEERALREEERLEPAEPRREDLLLVHAEGWVERVLAGSMSLEDELRAELPWSERVAQAHALAVEGTTAAARTALDRGLGIHVGGGAHHAFADHGEGFCLFNDLAVAAARLRREGLLRRVVVVDLDVHQGNGTASIFRATPDVFTFSMHQREGYPQLRQRSTLDLELAAGTGDDEYLDLLSRRIPGVLDSHRPELVLYQAGVDVHERDSLGTLRLSAAGIAARDRLVFEACARRAVPVAVTLGGGYGPSLEETAALHAATIREALAVIS